jgi:putative intracellular protease/amidase
MKILMVLTSHNQLGNTGRPTGFWLEEFAAPYFVFRDAGVELTLASPKGGQPPLDLKSDLPENQTPAMTRFKKDAAAQKALANTVKTCGREGGRLRHRLLSRCAWPDVGSRGEPYVHRSSGGLLQFRQANRIGVPFARALRHVTYQGAPLVKGKHVAGFTNGEEEERQLTKVVPFLVEDELLRLGAIYEKMANWQPFSITDGRLITGQNPASSTSAAQALLKLLTASESDSSIQSEQIGQKSYEMPPRDGISVAHFLTVADIDRPLRFYETVFGGRALSRGDSKGAPGYIQIANTWLLVNIGGGPTPDKPSVTLSVPDPRCGYSSLLQVMEKPRSRVHHGADPQVWRNSLLHRRSWLYYRGRPEYRAQVRLALGLDGIRI